MTTGIVTVSQYTSAPTAEISTDSILEVRGWYDRNFIGGDGVTPVYLSPDSGQSGFYYSITPTLNSFGDLVVPAHDIQATTLSNPTANYYEGLWVDGAFVRYLMPNTQGATGWQIPTVYGPVIAFDEIATYNRAKRLTYAPATYFTADQTIEEIRRIAGDFDYAAVGVNGITSMSVAPAVASLPIAVGDNDPRIQPASDTNIGITLLSDAPVTPSTPRAWAINAKRQPTLTAPVFWASQYSSYNAALTAIGSTKATLIVSGLMTGVTNATAPATLTQMFTGGGGLTLTSGHTLIIKGGIIAEPIKIFYNALAGQGTISFSGNLVQDQADPRWWGAVGDWNGTTGTDDTTALQAWITAIANTGVRGIVNGNPKFRVTDTLTKTTVQSLVLSSGMDAGNFAVNTPQFIWDGTGTGPLLNMDTWQYSHIEGFYWFVASGRTLNTFINIDGHTGGISTGNFVQYNTFHAGNQHNTNAKLVSISSTATNNNENMEVSYNTFLVSDADASSGTPVGIGIYIGPSSNAKHQKLDRNQISNAAVGIEGNGSFEVYFLGGGNNLIDIRAANGASEPVHIQFLETESSKQALVLGIGGSVTYRISDCRFSNSNQTNTGGFLKLDGQVQLENCKFESAPPSGGTLIEIAGTGNARIVSLNNKFAIAVTMAQLGYSYFASLTSYTYEQLISINDFLITNAPSSYFFQYGGVDPGTGNIANFFFGRPVQLRGYTFAQLMIGGAVPVAGTVAYITDSNTATLGATIDSGGGTNKVLSWFNGTAWTVVGK